MIDLNEKYPGMPLWWNAEHEKEYQIRSEVTSLLLDRVNEGLAPYGLQFVGGRVIESREMHDEIMRRVDELNLLESKPEDEEYVVVDGAIRFSELRPSGSLMLSRERSE